MMEFENDPEELQKRIDPPLLIVVRSAQCSSTASISMPLVWAAPRRMTGNTGGGEPISGSAIRLYSLAGETL